MEWETNVPEPEKAQFIIGFFGYDFMQHAVQSGQQPDPIIGFSACRRIQLIQIAEAYGIDPSLFNGSTPKSNIVKIMDVMWDQGKFKARPETVASTPDAEKPPFEFPPVPPETPTYEDMPWPELKALAASKGIATHRVKKPELIAALNG